MLLDVPGARLGEVDDPAALHLLDADQALVLELRDRRVDRPRAGAPDTAGPLADLLDDLVAVPRLLRDQGEDGAAHVTARGASSAAPAASGESAGRAARAETRTAGAEAAGHATPERASAAAATTHLVGGLLRWFRRRTHVCLGRTGARTWPAVTVVRVTGATGPAGLPRGIHAAHGGSP